MRRTELKSQGITAPDPVVSSSRRCGLPAGPCSSVKRLKVERSAAAAGVSAHRSGTAMFIWLLVLPDTSHMAALRLRLNMHLCAKGQHFYTVNICVAHHLFQFYHPSLCPVDKENKIWFLFLFLFSFWELWYIKAHVALMYSWHQVCWVSADVVSLN